MKRLLGVFLYKKKTLDCSRVTFEVELVGINNDSIDIHIDNKIKMNILAFPTMIKIINESETIEPIVGINGRFILDKDNNI